MTDRFETIYQYHAAEYDRLVRAEDYQGNLLRAIREIVALKNAVIAEMGAGTGRVTRLLASEIGQIIALDASMHMLSIAAESMQLASNCYFVVADNRCLPLSSSFADVSIEGWSFGHLTGWYPNSWRTEVLRALDELERVLKPGGTMILIETLGTGEQAPKAPNASLAEFYQMLESDLGFEGRAIRTDYRFESRIAAQESIDFFFPGLGLEDSLWEDDGIFLPECTGLWWRKA